jgi:hypothetical protein
MKKSTLREISKFAAGLIFGDMLWGLWLYFDGYLPMKFFGIYFNNQTVLAWIMFDIILFIFLINFAWHMGDRIRTKKEKKFHFAIGILFTLVALIHLSRILFSFDFTLGSWNVPYWLNGLGALVTGFFAYISFKLSSEE